MNIELTLEEITLIKQTLFLSMENLKRQDDYSSKLFEELEKLFEKMESLD